MSQSYNTLLFEVDEQGIATLIINRPDKLNALNDEVINELTEVFKTVNIDEEIAGVIITGEGDKAFVAGADIKELSKMDKQSGRMFSQKGQQIFQSIEDTRKPVIALINGYALGGGAELAMACHLRLADTNAVIGLPEVGLGIIPGYGGTQRLAHIVGKSRALEMILTGKKITANEAKAIGLINNIVSDENAMEEARELMQSILSNGPLAIQQALKAVYHSGDKNGYQVEADLFSCLCDTEDFKEGTKAFLEKRKPEFRGE